MPLPPFGSIYYMTVVLSKFPVTKPSAEKIPNTMPRRSSQKSQSSLTAYEENQSDNFSKERKRTRLILNSLLSGILAKMWLFRYIAKINS